MSTSHSESFFLDRLLPEEEAIPVGYARLIKEYNLNVPLPSQFCFISRRHQRYETPLWAAFTPRHLPEDSIQGHLTFALRYEGVDLAILRSLFEKMNPEIIARWVRLERTGSYSRRIWFLYEWLTGTVLDEPDVTMGNYVDMLSPKLQYGVERPIPSRRHRVNNNLPGSQTFCPLVRRTSELDVLINTIDKSVESLIEVEKDSPQRFKLSRRLALIDAHGSLSLDHVATNKGYVKQWASVLSKTNKPALSLGELFRLQSLFIPDQRFVEPGLRQSDDFQGDYDPITQEPVPEQIYAKATDLPDLMEGWLEAWTVMKEQGYNPILAAVSLAFGVGFIAPLNDGNARIQRYLFHYVLEQLGFLPADLVFSLSAIISNRSDTYQEILRSYAQPRLDLIVWEGSSAASFKVINETKLLYSYYDATAQAEFLYSCLKEVLTDFLPNEINELTQRDRLKATLEKKFDMPNAFRDEFIQKLQNNSGVIVKGALRKEFEKLTDKECQEVQDLYEEIVVNQTVRQP